ncbi:cytochrome P450 1A1-like [Lytechinus pictus]|uniref:cytochrome P450 1A1-like n=1 Tax=Lytechinus pictus TaxID=7653 RepID=UPI0030B9BF8C
MTEFLNLTSITAYAVVITAVIAILNMVRNAMNKREENDAIAESGGRSLPGPWGLPIIGNMLSVDTKNLHLSMIKLAKDYGNVYKLQLGSRPVLVLNGLEAIKHALIEQPVVFAGRPDMFTFNLMNSMSIYGPALAFKTHSEQLKLHRSIAEETFRHFSEGGRAQFFEDLMKGEAEELVGNLKASRTEGIPAIQRLLRLSVTNLSLWYLFSKRSSYDDKTLTDIISLTSDSEKPSGSGSALDFFPWLRYITTKSVTPLKNFRKKFGEILVGIIEEHDSLYESGSERDIMGHLITTGRNSEDELQRLGLNGKALYQSAFDFFPAGTETILATLEWMMVYMVTHPEVQSDVQLEIDNIIGRDRLPSWSDREKLPLTQSCLLEIQRHATAVPFAVPHSTTRDTVLDGYYIPKDMLVFVSIYSAHFDPGVWDKPEEFNPRRFLTLDGKLDEEKTKLAIPFSLGVRRCVGSGLARIKLFTYFTTFLHQLNFRCPDGEKGSIEPGSLGFPIRPKVFNVQIDPR